MRNQKRIKYLPLVFLVLGAAGGLLRAGLYNAALDEQGLLAPGCWYEPLLWALTAAAVLAAVVLSRGCRVADGEKTVCTAGSAALIYGIFLLAVLDPGTDIAALNLLHRVVGIAAILAMIPRAFFRAAKPKVIFASYSLLTLFLCLHMVQRYQFWSEQTQVQNYVFALFGSLCLLLFSYFQTVRHAPMKPAALQGAIGLAGIFFCCTAAAWGSDRIFYVTAALWLLSELSGLGQEE